MITAESGLRICIVVVAVYRNLMFHLSFFFLFFFPPAFKLDSLLLGVQWPQRTISIDVYKAGK